MSHPWRNAVNTNKHRVRKATRQSGGKYGNVSIQLGKELFVSVCDEADKENMSMSVFIRMCVDRELRRRALEECQQEEKQS